MPDQIAHTRFARKVYAALNEDLQARVRVDSPAFLAGCFGPDPLFNDPDPRRRAEGLQMHRRGGRESLERMREPIREKMPWAAEYAAGFFCHYALDRLCHPTIKEIADQGVMPHLALENAFDRFLYRRVGKELPRRVTLPDEALQTIARMYTQVDAKRFRADLNVFWQLRRFLILREESPLLSIAGKFSSKLNGLHHAAQITPRTQALVESLDILLEDSVAPAAEQLTLYFHAIDQDLPLDAWTDADFSGFQTQR